MSDLFKKLNVLLKASLNDIVSGDDSRPRLHLGRNVEGEVDTLRERVNDAMQYEDGIKARIQQFEDEAARWDAQADEAVVRGDDAAARYAVEQMRRAQQRAALTGSDLREHQRVTQDLIERVNLLEATVADAQQNAASRRAEAEAATESQPAPQSLPLPDLSGVLRQAQETITSLRETAAAQEELGPPAETNNPSEEKGVDDDLERRRQRLSKR